MEIDVNKMAWRNTPAIWRNDTNMRLIAVLMGVFDATNGGMSDLRSTTAPIIGYSAQRLSLEESLNDQFDSIFRRCQVVNNPFAEGLRYTFSAAESPDDELVQHTQGSTEDLELDSYTFYEGERSYAIVGFVVYIPSTVDSIAVRQWVDRVNIAGVSYELENL